ncbi:MAG: tRNA pseudouridine(13) synthase TruD [Candidatus Nanoarchaeia archaeon]|nr:tRNA pseudouridine(13) synthase TruD [Candidatus Nanoarchaeia archaeon]
MYKIKQIPEDFIVKEINELKIEEGQYSYFMLKKTNYTTERAVSAIAEYLKKPRKDIGYAGAKDKNALTEQFISIRGPIKKQDIKLKDIELKYIGNGKQRINLGNLKQNQFIITVRNLDELNLKINEKLQIPNYFDEQRFSENNAEVGKAIIKKDFKKAVELILGDNLKQSGFEKDVKEHTLKKPNDFIGSIKKVPKKISMMYVHAFQSLIFNETIAELIKAKTEDYKKVDYSNGQFVFPNNEMQNQKIPLIGFGTEFKNKEIEKSSLSLMEMHKVSFRDFIIRAMPELSFEGDYRDMFTNAENIKTEIKDDELNKNKKKCIISFTLEKGSYATIVIKKIFS